MRILHQEEASYLFKSTQSVQSSLSLLTDSTIFYCFILLFLISQLKKCELMAGVSPRDPASTQATTHGHITIGKAFYLDQLLGRGAPGDGLTLLLFLSVVGHTDLLQESNRAGDHA